MKKRAKRWLTLAAAAAALAAGGHYARVDLWLAGARNPPDTRRPAAPTREARWAQPLQAKGLDNFFKISGGLYRGQQPTDEGLASLQAMGVKTVVNLRVWHHAEKKEAQRLGMKYVEIDFNPARPEMEDVVAFLRAAADPANQPVFVHCQHGSDRTGTMVAAYRIYVDGWRPDQALEEMIRGGFGFHEEWVNLAEFVRRLDAGELRRLVKQ